jgi:hypothetical protein
MSVLKLNTSAHVEPLDRNHSKVSVVLSLGSSEPAPPNLDRSPVHVIAVIDISGSMATDAPAPGEPDGESSGLNILDLVKHSLRTVATILGPQDHLSIVAFDDRVETHQIGVAMDADGKTKTEASIKLLNPRGCTNLYGGLAAGLDLALHHFDDERTVHRHTSVLCLTDGIPNVNPPRGILPSLQRRVAQSGVKAVVHTFGFGYNLEADTLDQTARIFDGGFFFIPDASFVGTCMIHALSHGLATAAERVRLSIDLSCGEGNYKAQLADKSHPATCVRGGASTVTKTAFGATLEMGTVQYGQTRDVLVELTVPMPAKQLLARGPDAQPFLFATAFYEPVGRLDNAASEPVAQVSVALSGPCTPTEGSLLPAGMDSLPAAELAAALAEYHRFRLDTIDLLAAITAVFKQSTAHRGHEQWVKGAEFGNPRIAELAGRMKASPFFDALPALQGLVKDLEDQVTLGLSRADWTQKWGHTYLRSLARAHELQFVHNFKDASVTEYGRGALFARVRDAADDAFCSLPAPVSAQPEEQEEEESSDSEPSPGGQGSVPTRRAAAGARAKTRTAPPRRVISMARWNNAAGGCVAPDTLLIKADGTNIRADAVVAGTVLRVPAVAGRPAGVASVLVVVRTTCKGEVQLVRAAPDLLLTPWHPICVEGAGARFQFPVEVEGTASEPTVVPHVYSFLLAEPSGLSCPAAAVETASGVAVACLGHEVTEDPVLAHDFLGTSAVVVALRACAGFDAGLITLSGEAAFLRGPDGRICGIDAALAL